MCLRGGGRKGVTGFLNPNSQEVGEEQRRVGALNYLPEDRTGEERWRVAR